MHMGSGSRSSPWPKARPRGSHRSWLPATFAPGPAEVGSQDSDVIAGRTVELSTSGGRLTIEGSLSPGDVVIVELPGPEVGARQRLPALVWESYTGGAVVVFANLARAEYVKLRDYLNHFG